MYIYSKRGNPTAKLLAEKLRCKYGLRRKRCNPKWEQFKLIVNWGQSFREEHKNILNKCIKNKYTAFKLLEKDWQPIPQVFASEAGDFILDWPVVGRKLSHTQGNDIIFINNQEEIDNNWGNSDFYTQYIPKKSEFRVHVFKDQVLRVDKKVKIEGREYTENEIKIRSSANGWRQIKYNTGGRYYETLSEIGVRAIKAIGYDFGAVDIIININSEPIILEINSAPALRGDKLDLYATAFKEYSEKL